MVPKLLRNRKRKDRNRDERNGRVSCNSIVSFYPHHCIVLLVVCTCSLIESCSALVKDLPQKRHGVFLFPDCYTPHDRTGSRNSALGPTYIQQSSHNHCCTEEKNAIKESTLKLEPCALSSFSSPVLRNIHQSRVRPEIWQQYFCPPPFWVRAVGSILPQFRQSDGLDVKMQWNSSHLENLDAISERFMDLCDDQLRWKKGISFLPNENTMRRVELCRDIADGMLTFTQFCTLHRPIGDDASFSLRLTCSYGSSATKCPQWHIDHVPCRYVQALHGPGCMFIENGASTVMWDRMNALYDDSDSMDLSIQERNALLIDPDRAVVGQSQEGEAIILLGNAWWEKDMEFHPAVHKSPYGQMAPWQARILLTMDILEEHG